MNAAYKTVGYDMHIHAWMSESNWLEEAGLEHLIVLPSYEYDSYNMVCPGH